MKKLLYSPGYGAGWTTWADPELRVFMVAHPGIIKFLESGQRFAHDDTVFDYDRDTDEPILDDLHPVLRVFAEECALRFGHIPYLGGARDLTVLTVDDDVVVSFEEYDGSETPRYRDSVDWY